jgi:hypothetical protein
MNSRRKGKRGELEFAAFLRVHGFDGRRGQQYAGGAGSPDVVSETLDWLHIEVKRVQKFNLAEACAQARRDCAQGVVGGQPKPWLVAHRRNHEPWSITMDAEALCRILRKFLPSAADWGLAIAQCITMDAHFFLLLLRKARAEDSDANGGATDRTKGTEGTEEKSEVREPKAEGESQISTA